MCSVFWKNCKSFAVEFIFSTTSLIISCLIDRAKNETVSYSSKSLIGRVTQQLRKGRTQLEREDYLTVELLKDVARCVPGLQVVVFMVDTEDTSQLVAVDVALQPQVSPSGAYVGLAPLPCGNAPIHALYWHDGCYFDMLESNGTLSPEDFEKLLFSITSSFSKQKNIFEADIAAEGMCKECKKMVNKCVRNVHFQQ